MASVKDLRAGNTSAIVISMIVSGLGFYLAISVSDAVKSTVDSILPENDNEIVKFWISLFVAIVVVSLVIYVIVNYMKSQLGED